MKEELRGCEGVVIGKEEGVGYVSVYWDAKEIVPVDYFVYWDKFAAKNNLSPRMENVVVYEMDVDKKIYRSKLSCDIERINDWSFLDKNNTACLRINTPRVSLFADIIVPSFGDYRQVGLIFNENKNVGNFSDDIFELYKMSSVGHERDSDLERDVWELIVSPFSV